MTTVEVFAPAKINLTLHITGQRDDGYHLLDSLVVFASVRDRILIKGAEESSIRVEGPEATGVPADTRNLALRAVSIFSPEKRVALTLDKHLPIAAGIGGGSADAAAVVRGLLATKEAGYETFESSDAPSAPAISAQVLELGADVPMCLLSRSCRARGIGEKLAMVKLPQLSALLVNPRLPISTPRVFAALVNRDNDPMPNALPDFADAPALVEWLGAQRNDLQDAAISVEPEVARVLETIRNLTGCDLVRMSGSGATCFGIFESADAAAKARVQLKAMEPEWWMTVADLGDQSDVAEPRFS